MWQFDNRVVPNLKTALPGPKAQALLERDQRFMSPSYTRVYPLVVARGSGAVIEDVDGNLFLDFTAGIAVTSTGHCHPHVVAAIQDQAAKLLHMSRHRFLLPAADRPGPAAGRDRPRHVAQARLLHQQRGRGPRSGPEAGPLAHRPVASHRLLRRLPRPHLRRHVAVRLQARPSPRLLAAGARHPSRALPARLPRLRDADAGCACVEQIEETVLQRTAPPDEVAAIFVEPIQGEGGYHVPPPASCRRCGELCDRHGILLVADEVQSGMGRTGKLFAVEHWGVEPDILCLAKGIASGMPLGAIIARDEVMDWPSGSHASTFGGNPVSCRAALATLDLLEGGYIGQRGRARRATAAGPAAACRRQHPRRVGEVRGLGLMMAMDLVKEQRPPSMLDPALRDDVVQTGLPPGPAAAGLRRKRHPLLSAAVHHRRAGGNGPAHPGRRPGRAAEGGRCGLNRLVAGL